MGRRKQVEFDAPGITKQRNHELEDAAAIYRGHMLDRIEFAKKEAEAKEALIAVVTKQVEDGTLALPPDALDGEVVTVYRMDTDEGELEVKYGRKQQVRVRKVKESGDDEPEMME